MVNKWNVYCETESAWVSGYLDENITPSTCFNNNEHTINTDLSNIILNISTQQVNIVQTEGTPGMHYRAESKKLVASPNTTTTDTHTYPYDISPMTIYLPTSAQNEGDYINSLVGENTVVGVLTSSTSTGNTVLNVNSTVIQNMQVGYIVSLGNSNTVVGECTVIGNNQITISDPLDASYSAGTLVKISVNNIKNFYLQGSTSYHLGTKNLLCSFIPANTPIKMAYTNNSNETKDFYYMMEYYY
jgi:hypothetical protein